MSFDTAYLIVKILLSAIIAILVGIGTHNHYLALAAGLASGILLVASACVGGEA